ncbi:type 1 glutamine amidotransferase [Streptomyces piniterrae]|uniref:Type 1 glutamine amidotransferase n=1 Tax=Streptomyces piniterrae TaxID=2571125 RepID=A0A4U0MU43_9ACTN|nr:type 1 glutamine amidotransferase domain-containing protein [Streptomyces piniterrae]TJZ44489.1 type 1 glutamine amidotransferase [Streptomyces piniterrae]
MQIAFLVAPKGVEQIELTESWQAVIDSGETPHLISTRSGRIQAFDHLEKAETFPVDRTVDAAKVSDYAGLVLPGGLANPDALRMDKTAVKFVRDFFDAGKPVAAICHAPWTLIEADVVRGRTLTSFPSLQTDIRNAGGTWVDEQVKVCTAGPSTLITSRRPGDLEAFCSTFLSEFSQAVQRA